MTSELPGQIRELMESRAHPITPGEIIARAHTAAASSLRPAADRPRVIRAKVRLGWAAAVAAAVVAVGSAGAISALHLMTAGRPAGPPAARPTGRTGTVLTAAQMRQVTEASRSALANSARAYVTYLGPGPYHAFQSENIAFSGANYSFSGSVINPAASGRPGQVAWFAERLINGQAYYHELGSKGWHWFHYASPGAQIAHILDPRTMLEVLMPSERFRFAGHVVAGGVTLERLQATDPANVPNLGSLTGLAAGEYPTALTVLIDSRGVVHQVDISLRGPTLTAAAGPGKPGPGKPGPGKPGLGKPVPGKAELAREAPPARGVSLTREASLARKASASFAVAGSTSVIVTFADIGQPQYISAPRHAISARVLWGGNSRPLPPPVMLSAGVAGN